MGLMDGKIGLVFGVANEYSIAWGISQAMHAEGATLAFSYAGPALEKRVRKLATGMGAPFIEPCDLTKDEELDAVFAKFKQAYGHLDFLVHAVAFAPQSELMGRFRDTTRAGFNLALDVSCYSLIAVSKRAAELMSEGGSIVTMTYYGSTKVTPNYNVMGVAKAGLEAAVRYLAFDLGQQKIRVNAISAGPIRTLAAMGITGFTAAKNMVGEAAPLGNVSQADVGNAARYLLSDLSTHVTGEVLYVDGGYNIMGAFIPQSSGDKPQA